MTAEAKNRAGQREETIQQLPLAQIAPDPHNPREEFDQAELQALAESLGELGMLEPAIVRPSKTSGRYELIVGERRWRAAKLAGWKELPCVVRDVSDGEVMTLQLVENVQRADLNPIEVARGLQTLCRRRGDPCKGNSGLKTQAGFQQMIGKSREWVNRHLQLLKLPESWQQRVIAGEFTFSQALQIARHAKDPRVLERLEADMADNPWAYQAATDFERSAKQIIEELGVVHRPNRTDRQRKTARRPAARVAWEREMPADEADVVPFSNRATRAALAEILAAINAIADVGLLDRIIAAARTRREAIAETVAASTKGAKGTSQQRRAR